MLIIALCNPPVLLPSMSIVNKSPALMSMLPAAAVNLLSLSNDFTFSFPFPFFSVFNSILLGPVDSFMTKVPSSMSRSFSISKVPPVRRQIAPSLIVNFLSLRMSSVAPFEMVRLVVKSALNALLTSKFLPSTVSEAAGPSILSLPPFSIVSLRGVKVLFTVIIG